MSNFSTETEEFVSVTKVGRNFGQYLEALQKDEKEKFIILRNNEPEAVLLTMEMYQMLQTKLQELEELLEDLVTSREIAARVEDKKNLKSAVTLEELGKRHGLEK
ncbi:MAG TPA: type II toxin-antitoxin system Phd/YefM family antitoxin [bacterium]|nr:type II toxin-antitoxin system Phd/YefM family antitoxin [bacterium]